MIDRAELWVLSRDIVWHNSVWIAYALSSTRELSRYPCSPVLHLNINSILKLWDDQNRTKFWSVLFTCACCTIVRIPSDGKCVHFPSQASCLREVLLSVEGTAGWRVPIMYAFISDGGMCTLSIFHHPSCSIMLQPAAVTTLRQLLVFFLHFGATPHFSFFTYSRTSYPYILSTTLYPYMLCTSLKKEPLYPYTLGTSLKQQNTKFQRGHLLT